jgi:hypothetical protein
MAVWMEKSQILHSFSILRDSNFDKPWSIINYRPNCRSVFWKAGKFVSISRSRYNHTLSQ